MANTKISEQREERSRLLKSGDIEGYHRLQAAFHRKGTGQYISDVILGANDGIITTFVVVAGAVGASLNPLVILVLGFANVLGDATSMGFGNYLGQKSEADYHRAQRKKEEWEIEKFPDTERWETEEIFKKWGFHGKDLQRAVDIVTADKQIWVDIMMREEMGIVEVSDTQAAKSGVATFIAFTLAGSVPLLPFLIPALSANAAMIATVFSAVELFVIGSLRSLTSMRAWFVSGIEMLLVGALAGGIAYGVGYAVDRIVSTLM